MSGSAIFDYIEAVQAEAPLGHVLDAGTGPRSMRWLLSLSTDSVTAVTGAKPDAAQLQRMVGDKMRPQDRLIVGNWADPDLLAGERFDTVVADYLLGAIEGFAPYFQTALFPRLRELTNKRLYLTSAQPYVVDRPADEAGGLIWEIGRFRDACLLLTGKQPYREFPIDWVLAQLQRASFRVVGTRKFPVGYKANFVTGQIDMCRPRLERLPARALGQSLIAHGEALRSRALAYIDRHGSLSHGFAYAIAAEPV